MNKMCPVACKGLNAGCGLQQMVGAALKWPKQWLTHSVTFTRRLVKWCIMWTILHRWQNNLRSFFGPCSTASLGNCLARLWEGSENGKNIKVYKDCLLCTTNYMHNNGSSNSNRDKISHRLHMNANMVLIERLESALSSEFLCLFQWTVSEK